MGGCAGKLNGVEGPTPEADTLAKEETAAEEVVQEKKEGDEKKGDETETPLVDPSEPKEEGEKPAEQPAAAAAIEVTEEPPKVEDSEVEEPKAEAPMAEAVAEVNAEKPTETVEQKTDA